jgi:hypothetical protein
VEAISATAGSPTPTPFERFNIFGREFHIEDLTDDVSSTELSDSHQQ